MSQSKVRKIHSGTSSSHSTQAPERPSKGAGAREEITDLVRKIGELSGKNPEKTAKILHDWIQRKAGKKAA